MAAPQTGLFAGQQSQGKKWEELKEEERGMLDYERWMRDHSGNFSLTALGRYVEREGHLPNLTTFNPKAEFKARTSQNYIFSEEEIAEVRDKIKRMKDQEQAEAERASKEYWEKVNREIKENRAKRDEISARTQNDKSIFERIEDMREIVSEIKERGNDGEYWCRNDSLANQGDLRAIEIYDYRVYWGEYMDSTAWGNYGSTMTMLCDGLLEYLADPAAAELKYGSGKYNPQVLHDIKSLGAYLQDRVLYRARRNDLVRIDENTQKKAASVLAEMTRRRVIKKATAECKEWLAENLPKVLFGLLGAGILGAVIATVIHKRRKRKKEEEETRRHNLEYARRKEVEKMEAYEKWKAGRLKKWDDYKLKYKAEIVDLVKKIVDISDYYYYKARCAASIEETMKLMDEVMDERLGPTDNGLAELAEKNPEDMPRELVRELGFGGVKIPKLRRMHGTHTPHAADKSPEAYIERATRVRENVTTEDKEIFEKLKKYVTEVYGGEP